MLAPEADTPGLTELLVLTVRHTPGHALVTNLYRWSDTSLTLVWGQTELFVK